MLHAIPGTLLAALTFGVVGLLLLGVGLALRRLFGLRELDLDAALLAPWVGFAAVMLFLMAWNFALPVDDRARLLVALAGAGGLWANRQALAELGAAHPLREARLFLALAAILGLWTANLALGPMANWDSSLYHMQATRWAREYPAVPGLANLFGPLAFNNASVLWNALLAVGPWRDGAWHVAHGGLVVLALLPVLVSAHRFHARRGEAADLFTLLLLAPLVATLCTEQLTSFMPDVPLRIVRLMLLAAWYRLLAGPRRAGPAEHWTLVSLVALAAVGVAVKMNATVFAALLVVTAGVLWLRTPAGPASGRARAVAWSTAIGLAFAVAWAGRGIVLSGYPAFPSRVLAAPVDWRAPAEHAEAEFDYIVHSTRSSTGNLDFVAGRTAGFGAWLPHWLRRLPEALYDLPVPLGLAVVLLPLALRRGSPRPGGAGAAGTAWWMLVPLIGSLIPWFLVAPAPRYMTAVFWGLPALLAAQVFARGGWSAMPQRHRPILAGAFLLGLSPAVVLPLQGWVADGRQGNPLQAVLRAGIILPPPGQLAMPAAGTADTYEFVTTSDLLLHVPTGRCWDAPLPCTPNPAPNLSLRNPADMARGFRVTGGWRMLDWPERWKAAYRAAWDASRRDTTP